MKVSTERPWSHLWAGVSQCISLQASVSWESSRGLYRPMASDGRMSARPGVRLTVQKNSAIYNSKLQLPPLQASPRSTRRGAPRRPRSCWSTGAQLWQIVTSASTNRVKVPATPEASQRPFTSMLNTVRVHVAGGWGYRKLPANADNTRPPLIWRLVPVQRSRPAICHRTSFSLQLLG